MSQAEDPLIDCPLDKVHRIRTSRLQVHLVRCLKNHTLSTEKVKCPFNPLHIVERVELTHHTRTCPDSASVILDQFDIEGEKCFSGTISLEELNRQYDQMMPRQNDCRKTTTNAPGYDPTANIENKPVFRILSCESKSKKREFRLRERARFAALEEDDKKNKVPQYPSPQTFKPLRRPHTIPTNPIDIDTNLKCATVKQVSDDKVKNVPIVEQKVLTVEKSQVLKAKENITSFPTQNQNNRVLQSDSENIVTLDDMKVTSLEEAFSQLKMLVKTENAIKERKNKLLNIISLSNTKKQEENVISYRDDALIKSCNDSKAATNNENWHNVRMKKKCAANFDMIAENSKATTSTYRQA